MTAGSGRALALCAAVCAASGLCISERAGALPEPLLPEKNACLEPSAPLALGSAQWNGWGRDLENTRYQPEPALRATDVPKLALKWAFGFQGSAVAGQPTVVDGRLFVVSAVGRIYSLDAITGCTYWTYDVPAGTRTAIAIAESAPPRSVPPPRGSAVAARPTHGKKKGAKKTKHALTLAHLDLVKAPSAAYFGDDAGAVYALDAQKGTLLWRTVVEDQPSARIVGAPVVYRGSIYVAVASNELTLAENAAYACCSFRGSVVALDATTGRVTWKTYAIGEEARAGVAGGAAGAAITGSPTIDVTRNLLYVGTGAASTAQAAPRTDAVIALGISDGTLRWSRQFARHDRSGGAEFYGSPILRTLADGKQIIMAGQASGIVYALDPDRDGEVLWQTKVTDDAYPAGIEWGSAADHRRLYVALSGLVAEPDNLLGGLAALDMKTGALRWFTPGPAPVCSWGTQSCTHAEAQAVTVIPGVAFSGSMDGHLRAYSTIDGKILWDVETAREFTTVNGVKASGGSLDQGGPTIVNGVVYINSGYGQRYGQPGNVLLAFTVDGK
jgi:polyvinyl alcohol dehydrogenase (cytochrome)